MPEDLAFHLRIQLDSEYYKLRSKGQEKSLAQLLRIESASQGAFKIKKIFEPAEQNIKMFVRVEINCTNIKKNNDGLPLRKREVFVLNIPGDFPYSYPHVYVEHKRFSGFSHVQWVRHLCLYLSPETEWNISDGMYGFIERLRQWLIQGAINAHEIEGHPIHPPAMRSINYKLPSIIIRENTPEFEQKFWLGFAVLDDINEQRVDLIGWQQQYQKPESGFLAPVILLNNSFPFEYPDTAEELFYQLEKIGISLNLIHLLALFSAGSNEDIKPLYLVLGTSMRGIKDQTRLQHLSVWSIHEQIKETIKLEIKCLNLIGRSVDEEFKSEVEKLNAECRESSLKQFKLADMRWCSVKEDRPEVTIRRDANTSAQSYLGKSVAIWGCGALGSYIAELLVRSGVSHLMLRDNKKVHPGILVRQNFEDEDIGNWKCESLKKRLHRINPRLSIETDIDDISHSFNAMSELSEDKANPYDLIIDATASNKLHLSLEEFIKDVTPNTSLASVIIGSTASRALLTYFPSIKNSLVADALRKSKITALNTKQIKSYAKEFWPDQGEFLNFQPEPGCSDPTFIGSAIDMAILVGKVMDALGNSLHSAKTAYTLMLSKNNEKESISCIEHPEDIIANLPDSYQVRLSKKAHKNILKFISKSKKIGREICETGGLLFGQIDHASEIIWITEIMGPPKDSKSLPEKFDCGIQGTAKFNSKLMTETKGSVHYIGMWHTHPVSAAKPSVTDMQGMAGLMCNEGFAAESQMLLIVGYSSSKPQLGFYQYSTSEITAVNDGEIKLNIEHNGSIIKVSK
jgi:integrative and conjugative element protein (TIGR02256 family)